MDTPTKIFGHRLRASIEGKGYSIDSFAKKMGISRATLYNWFERDAPPPSKTLQTELVRVLEEPAEYILWGHAPSKKAGHLKSGHELDGLELGPPIGGGAVAERFPQEERRPATKADCEAYMAELLARADSSNDPNAFPYILRKMRKEFPLDEWDELGPMNA